MTLAHERLPGAQLTVLVPSIPTTATELHMEEPLRMVAQPHMAAALELQPGLRVPRHLPRMDSATAPRHLHTAVLAAALAVAAETLGAARRLPTESRPLRLAPVAAILGVTHPEQAGRRTMLRPLVATWEPRHRRH